MTSASTDIHQVPAKRRAVDVRVEDAVAVTDTCHCGEAFETCGGCGAPRCPGCEPVRDDDCRWGV